MQDLPKRNWLKSAAFPTLPRKDDALNSSWELQMPPLPLPCMLCASSAHKALKLWSLALKLLLYRSNLSGTQVALNQENVSNKI